MASMHDPYLEQSAQEQSHVALAAYKHIAQDSTSESRLLYAIIWRRSIVQTLQCT